MLLDQKLSRANFWRIVLNSTASFVMAYLLVFYINHFATVFTAGMFHYPVSFNFAKIVYHVEPYEWTHDAVKLMYSAGPLLILIAGIIALVAFFSLLEEVARVKIFFVWLCLHAFNYFFGGLLIGNIFTQGIGHVFNWMYLTDTSKMLVALVGFFGLLSTAILISRPIAISANSYFNELNNKNKPFFIMAQFVVPYVIGSALVVLYFLPVIRFQEKYSWISLGVLVLIGAVRMTSLDSIYFDEEDRKISLSYALILTALIGYLAVRFFLNGYLFINW